MKPFTNWFPDTHQVVVLDVPSDNYLRSVWIGLTAALLNLPTAIWTIFARGGSFKLVWRLLVMIFWAFPVLGFQNKLTGSYETHDEVVDRLQKEAESLLNELLSE